MYTKGECSCKVVSAFLIGNSIEYCPLHKSAPDLYEALKALNEQLTGANIPFSQGMFDAKINMRQALAKAEA